MFGIDLNPLQPLLKNEYVRYVLVLLAGITIGALFYPTKRVEERVSQKYEQQIKTLNQVHSQELQTSKSQLDKVTSESRTLQSESQEKISQLTTQVHDLQTSRKTTYYKLVHPDGTTEIRETTDSETEESDKVATQVQAEYQQKLDTTVQQLNQVHETQVSQMQKDYTSKAESYEQTISELKKEKITETGVKKFGVEGGYLNDKDYYVHATGDLWGPFFLGIHGETGPTDSKLGVGLGIRF